MPTPAWPSLPVEDCLPALRAALAGDGAAVLQAPPGAGKTTIVPLGLLGEPWLDGRRIVVLEPRRLAARAAARRMATLRGEDVGATVGYRTRDERRTSAATRVEVVTEGILTRRLQHDPELPGVGLVVFDEFHERSLQADLGLALAIDVRRTLRPDLRVLVMSATLDVGRVADLLGVGAPAPVVTSEGRTHPVDVRWAPPRPRTRPDAAAADTVRRALRQGEGDVLVFLPGAAEIRRAADRLGDQPLPGALPVDVRPLYGALPAAEQDAAVAPGPPGRRKVVLSTDIAETSLTVEGVRAVVDAGMARVPRFDARTGMTRLTTVAASKASADQRAGRAGRTAPGTAYRMWSKVEHAARPPFSAPEIAQVDLAGLALELAGWGTGPEALALLDPPPARTLEEGRALLTSLGALDGDGRPTPAGRAMLDLPLHPRLARAVIGARAMGQGWLGALVAALLEDRDVLRGRPDEVPADLALRVALLADPGRRHPGLDGRALRRARDRAVDLARRAGVEPGPVAPVATGAVVALAYPDRVGRARGGTRGRYRLRGGGAAWVSPIDELADERTIVAADLDGNRREARVRLGAALDDIDLEELFGPEIVEVATLEWDGERDDLVVRARRRLGELDLATVERPPTPGPEVVAALVAHVRRSRLDVLPWTPAARALQARVGFLRRQVGPVWPDLGDEALLEGLDGWLAPFLVGATGRRAVDGLDLVAVLGSRLGGSQRPDLDRLAPATIALPSGRRVPVDYAPDQPVMAARVQELFGVTANPTVAGGAVPVVVHLLSPAGRPVQVTADLAGFWAGSWQEVRKEMAGRYPKHAWPQDPTAEPPRR